MRVDAVTDKPVPPLSLTAARKSNRPDYEEWKAAATAEMAAKSENGTIRELIPCPDNETIIKTRLVYTWKYNEVATIGNRSKLPSGEAVTDGTIYDHRARWVACDYLPAHARKNVNATYVATGKHAGIRTFMSVCVQVLGIIFRKVDAIKAFTQVHLPTSNRVLVLLPDGFKQFDKSGRELCAWLRMALEGLRESGNLFQVATVEWLTNEGNGGCFGEGAFTQLVSEPTTFVWQKGNAFLALSVWIDDIWTACNNDTIFKMFYEAYGKRWNAKELPALSYAGYEVDHMPGAIKLHCTRYLQNTVAKFGPDCIEHETPAPYDKSRTNLISACNLKLGDSEKEQKAMVGIPYLACLATLLFAVGIVHGEAAHTICALCRYMHLPSPKAWEALTYTLGYFKKYPGRGITYVKDWKIPKTIPMSFHKYINDCLGLYFYTDASWKVGSTYAGVIIMFGGGMVDWMSRLIKVICHSTAEAEICAGCFGTKRIAYVRNYIIGLGMLVVGPVLHIIDNTAAEALAAKMGVSKMTEHFQRWQQTMRYSNVYQHTISLWATNKIQLADGMTKVVDVTSFNNMVREIMGAPISGKMCAVLYAGFEISKT